MNGILDHLKEIGALREGHFPEANGSCSRIRVSMPRLFQLPEQTQRVAAQIAEQLAGKSPDIVVGVGEGSVILAYELARQMNARCMLALRHNGTMTVRREFDAAPGEHALIVEDVVSTGKSIRETVELLRALNASILGISAILDMSDGRARFRFPFYPLAVLSRGNAPRQSCPLCRAGIPLTQE